MERFTMNRQRSVKDICRRWLRIVLAAPAPVELTGERVNAGGEVCEHALVHVPNGSRQ